MADPLIGAVFGLQGTVDLLGLYMFSEFYVLFPYLAIFRFPDPMRQHAWDRGTSAQIGNATGALGHGTSPSVWDVQ